MELNILQPVVMLHAWSLLVLVWMVASRLPAMKAAGIDLGRARGSKPGGLDGVLPHATQWKAHNYIHLMEQPTLFYAICLTLAVLGAGGGLNAELAWAYALLRILHSLVQGTVNIIRFRFALFALSTLALVALTVHAAMMVF